MTLAFLLGGNFMFNRATDPDYGDISSSVLVILGVMAYIMAAICGLAAGGAANEIWGTQTEETGGLTVR